MFPLVGDLEDSRPVNALLPILSFGLVICQFAVPRHLAFAPLLIAACNLPNVPVVEVGVSLTAINLIILAGLLRAAKDRALAWSPFQLLDVLVALWTFWAILSAVGHNPKYTDPVTERLLLVYNTAGTYLYARTFLRTRDDFRRLTKCLVFLMMLLAPPVAFEKVVGLNISWAIANGELVEATVRNGSIRAAGPFSHPVLAGTVAATSLVLLVPLLCARQRRWAAVGAACCLIIVYCAASSGPIITLFAGAAALFLWLWRRNMKLIRVSAIVSVILLQVAMTAPVWYLIHRIDFTGGSTGFHRAELITQALKHLDRWWFIGTDYTRDWIPSAVGWDEDQVDMTNYYLRIGVTGGLPLMLCFLLMLGKAFQALGRCIRLQRRAQNPDELMLWCIGSALAAHCVTFLSISYFDQTVVFVWIIIGAVPGLCAITRTQRANPKDEDFQLLHQPRSLVAER